MATALFAGISALVNSCQESNHCHPTCLRGARLMKTSKPQASFLRLLAWMPAVLVFCCGFLPVSVVADDHNKYHASDYQYWKQPGTNASCCSDSDCAPV